MNKPIPAPMAFFNDIGMAFTIASRKFVNVNTINNIPSIKTAVKANCQLFPIAIHTVKAKKAFNPIPGAKAKGNFAHKAITNVATTEDRAVAVNTAPLSIPACPRISGFYGKNIRHR